MELARKLKEMNDKHEKLIIETKEAYEIEQKQKIEEQQKINDEIESEWFYKYVEYAKKNKLIIGDKANLYKICNSHRQDYLMYYPIVYEMKGHEYVKRCNKSDDDESESDDDDYEPCTWELGNKRCACGSNTYLEYDERDFDGHDKFNIECTKPLGYPSN